VHGLVTNVDTGCTSPTNCKVSEILDYSDTAADVASNSAFGELRHQKVTSGASVLADLTYDSSLDPRDNLGRVQVKTEKFGASAARDIEYHYDERNRLEAVDNGALSESFTYDTNGNRTSYTGPSGSIASANIAYDDQDRLYQYGSTAFTYGKNGERRTKVIGSQTTTYTYDALGNLTKVTRTGGADINYLVDGLGRRIGKTVTSPAFNRRWIYRDGLHPVAEVDGVTGAILARYIYGSRRNVPDFVVKGGVTYRLIVDQLGSPRMAVNIADPTQIPYRVDYSAFGEPTPVGATTLDWIPFGFAGGIYDKDTGLVRFGARDYDASVGRWVSKDPILFRGRDTNLYAYVFNDPVNYIDPIGWTGFGVAAGGSAEAGIGFLGAGATGGVGAGLFLNDHTGDLSGGAFADFGAFAGTGRSGPACPPSAPPPAHAVAGAAAGVGGGIFFTNANSVGDLAGYFENFSLNTPFFSAQYATGGGIWSFTLTYGAGAGISGSGYPTSTWTWP
jgi:RHS repeat-associated protein